MQERRTLDWDDLRLFLAVAREGQMLGAAAKLGMSQSRLSRHLAALERALGARLLERTTRGSVPTPDGEALMAAAEAMEAAALSGIEGLRGAGEVTGTVRIAAPDGFGGAFLAPRMGRFRERHPGLRVELVPAPRTVSLSEREADLAVLVGRPEKGRLSVRRLTDYTLGLYASHSYLAGRARPETPSDLAAHALVGYVDDLVYAPELAYAREVWPGWRSDVAVSTAAGQVEAVRASAGIGILHDFMATGLVRLMPGVRVRRSYWLAVHENLARAPRVRAAANLLVEMVEEARASFAPSRPAP